MMKKLYVLSHSARRFEDDFVTAGTHVKHPSCSGCGRNMNDLLPPLLYEWDEEFGNPQESINKQHDCYWGEFSLLVTENGRSILEELDLSFEFFEATPVSTSLVGRNLVIKNLPPPDMKLFQARPATIIDADAAMCSNSLCDVCGKFSQQVRQITRLKLVGNVALQRRVITIRQNRGEPIFVSEDTKSLIVDSGLKGIGFYPAGRIFEETDR